ncbi:hypothetical protein GMOD_00003688 [Pyrenophora seminiperda CCB06]|uniref:Uncharacterized protein n=1 Tax=Pyrenophora seminiperda CCB06 TaxID=1302712 RepID=A0A3M7MJQ8_9PLEO|nr:hypothetical protein GMOD_00003688 [Pyrenophora seminiperda CCB06]
MTPLYCPSKKKTVNDFVIGAYQLPEQVLQGVRLALNIKYAALYTVNAKAIGDPHSLQEDQRVLVAAHATEKMLPDAPYGFVLYDGEEGGDVDPDTEGYGQAWDELSDYEKCLHVRNLNELKPTTRNKLRITRPYKSVQADMDALSSSEPLSEDTDYEITIEERWAVTIEHFLPSSMKLSSPKSSSKTWDPAMLAALYLFSSCTHGQERLAREVLDEVIALRTEQDQGDDKDPMVREQDVLNAIIMVYERAGVLPTKTMKLKTGKARRKDGKKASKGKSKAASGCT